MVSPILCRYHRDEGRLRNWLMQRRVRRILVTKRMLIRKAKEICLGIRDLTDNQLEDWWAAFKRRRNISAHRVSSYRRGIDEVVLPLVRRYRALLHDAIRRGLIQWLGNGDETQVNLEPVASKCLDDKGRTGWWW